MLYNESSIVVLEGLEAVRQRPKMYVGDTGQGGLNKLIAELVGNAVGEVTEGHATTIRVHLKGDSLMVEDDGRGIPVDLNRSYGMSPLEVIFTSLNSGCNCGCDEPAGHRVGDAGVGVSVVNALSAWLDVETVRDGHLHRIGFTQGRVTHALEDLGATERKGTRVTFALDRTVFELEVALDTPWLEEHLRELPLGDLGSVDLTRE
ncbi:MAG: DNA gyrase subunit B [Polyangiales bacterium]|jgi:DNA gyrase subunit B